MNETLKKMFLELMARYSSNEPFNFKCWQEIETSYSQKHRAYHTLQHLNDMFALLKHADQQIADLDVMLFSIFYHDIVYKITKSDNEYQSALLFKKRMAKTSFKSIEKTMRQIELTKEHYMTDDFDANFLLDIDLSVLGKSRDVYRVYAEAVRMEYKIYPTFLFNKGRKKVLSNFLNTPHIYKTAYFKAHFEQNARDNMKWELEAL